MADGIMGRAKAWAASDRAEARGEAARADQNDARIKARVTSAGRTAYNSARAFVRGATKSRKQTRSGSR
jgi:hypothetical protein